MIIVGIDPGLTGALAFLGTGHKSAGLLTECYDMPLMPNGNGMVKRRVDCDALAGIFRWWASITPSYTDTTVVIEDVQPFGNNGAVGMFSLGQSLGAVRGVASGYNYRVMLVKPAAWKKDLGLNRDKHASLTMARKLFPAAPLSLKKHEGRAEALLLAHWYLTVGTKQSNLVGRTGD